MNATLALDGYGLTKSVRIKLKRTHSGDIEEFEPQSRYCKAHIKQINKHGAGPFCQFAPVGLPSKSGICVVTAKGQVTLRKEVLRHLGVQPGDKISADLLNDHRIELRPKPGKAASTIFGLLAQSNTERLTIGEIGEAAAAGWAGEE